jgi:mannan endo-1,6-alpha-mannosidase
MSVMTAAEFNFPNPPADKPQWLELAQAVFNTQAPRIDYEFCGGGLRWQAYRSLNGYDYKNSISNGCFFNIGARLALYTRNDTYAQYAEQTWDWMRKIGFMDNNYAIYDGAHVQTNCTDINPVQFSYNAGVFLLGAATMYNYVSAFSGIYFLNPIISHRPTWNSLFQTKYLILTKTD